MHWKAPRAGPSSSATASVHQQNKPPTRRPAVKCPSGDNSPKRTRFVGVGGQRFVGFEMHVALDGRPERAAEVTDLVHADETDLGRSWILAFLKSLMHGQSTKAAAAPVSAIPALLGAMAFPEEVDLLRSVIETADVSQVTREPRKNTTIDRLRLRDTTCLDVALHVLRGR